MAGAAQKYQPRKNLRTAFADFFNSTQYPIAMSSDGQTVATSAETGPSWMHFAGGAGADKANAGAAAAAAATVFRKKNE